MNQILCFILLRIRIKSLTLLFLWWTVDHWIFFLIVTGTLLLLYRFLGSFILEGIFSFEVEVIVKKKGLGFTCLN